VAARDKLRDLLRTIPCEPANAEKAVFMTWALGLPARR